MNWDLDDLPIREAAFEYLDRQRVHFGGELPWSVLREGFWYGSDHFHLLSQQGIFIPKGFDPPIPLSIKTTPPEPDKPPPYEDEITPDGFLRYRYRGDEADRGHRENVGLRLALERQTPLIYFLGVDRGWYSAHYPVFVVGDEPERLAVRVAVDERLRTSSPYPGIDVVAEPTTLIRRAYATRLAVQRLHQDQFRAQVLRAYRTSCSICRLKQRPLLDAAHIIPDKEELGAPSVSNGLSLCKLHHSAFDSDLIGIRPDLVVEVREDIRRQEDGPMLVHGLQGFHGRRLMVVPARSTLMPSVDLLEERFARFRRAG